MPDLHTQGGAAIIAMRKLIREHAKAVVAQTVPPTITLNGTRKSGGMAANVSRDVSLLISGAEEAVDEVGANDDSEAPAAENEAGPGGEAEDGDGLERSKDSNATLAIKRVAVAGTGKIYRRQQKAGEGGAEDGSQGRLWEQAGVIRWDELYRYV